MTPVAQLAAQPAATCLGALPLLGWSGASVLEAASSLRKRHVVSQSGALEDGVAALLPKMKRMRLRPSLGQLRLQREAEDTESLPPEVKLAVEPEQLRASVSIEIAVGDCGFSGGSDLVYLELSFPPQYPHRPPKICQVAPEGCLPFWRYEGSFILLERLTERAWSSAMGVSDIVKDLLRPMGWGGPGCVGVFEAALRPPPAGVTFRDVEMV